MSAKTVRDVEAIDLLEALHGNNTDLKIEKLQTVKANIKHQNVQNEAIAPLFEACRLGLTSSNGQIFMQTLSCIGHLIKRVSLQEPAKLKPHLKHTMPLLFDKCADSKERTRSIATNALTDLWKACPPEVEKHIKDSAFVNRNPRIRETCLLLIKKRHHDEKGGFSFRSFTPFVVQLLEDADANVRETAKEVVVDLFKDAPGHAKADLKREINSQMVRKAIATAIISQLGIPEDVEDGRSKSRADGPVPSGRKATAAPTGSTVSSYLTSITGYEMEHLESEYVNTARELDTMFQEMLPPFEGRESEQNWAARERAITKLRQLIRGNAIRDYPQNFFAGIKLLMDGILKGMSSLRTTLSCNGMQLVKDLSMLAGAGLDATMVEFLLSTLVRLCAGTKKITAQTGFVSTATLLANVPFSAKVLHHIWLASQDKNVQPREYASGWIRVILESHIDQKNYMEHSGCVDTFEKCIRKGVTDANPKVRENMRVTFWKFAAIWPARAAALLATLEGSNRTLLEKANPDGNRPASAASTASVPRTASTTSTARSSVKDAIAAKRKAFAQAEAASNLMPPPPNIPSQSAGASRPARPAVRSRPGTGMGAYSDSAVARAGSPAVKPSPTSRGNGVRSPTQTSPPQLRTVRSTPIRQQSPAVIRQPSLMEQLNNQDPRVRLDGIASLKAVLQRKANPSSNDGQKLPALPPPEILAVSLQKLLQDENSEVVEQVIAPELLIELEKAVALDLIFSKVILFSEIEVEIRRPLPNSVSSLATLKTMVDDSEAASILYKLITLMASPVMPKKLAAWNFSSPEKKRILNGSLRWLSELFDKVLAGRENEFLTDEESYRQYVNRFIPMLKKLKDPGHQALAHILHKCQKLDSSTFEKITYTFDPEEIKDMKAAWGQADAEGASASDEDVPGIDKVLSTAPRSGAQVLTEVSHPRDRLENAVERSPSSPRKKGFFEPTNTDEDFTMIQPVSSLGAVPGLNPTAISSEDKENKDVVPSAKSSLVQQPASSEPVLLEKTGPILNTNERLQTAPEVSHVQSKAVANAIRTLQSLIGRIKNREIDTPTFRKLINLARENPVRDPSKPGSNDEEWCDIWEGGRIFDDLMSSLLEYLNDDAVNRDSNKTADLHAQAVLVIRQLLSKATPYFVKHESNVLITFIRIRGKHTSISSVTTGIIETCEELTNVADSGNCLPRITEYLGQPDNLPTQSKSMALNCMGALIRTASQSALERLLNRIGAITLKYLDDADADVRRSCTAAVVELHVKVQNDKRMFEEILKGVNVNQQNLLLYYFARKDAELRV